jgi:hypothetical protein
MKDEIEEYMKKDFVTKTENILYDIIKYEFPKIKNLEVRYSDTTANLRVSFDEGIYTRDEILNKVNEYRSQSYKIKK